METVAWIGSIALALCALPQTILCVKQKHARGLSWGFIGIWFTGEVCMLSYVFSLWNWPLIFNYGANAVMLAIILTYKVKDERAKAIQLLQKMQRFRIR
jgi:uncharacterized protein with PQ loop repeat